MTSAVGAAVDSNHSKLYARYWAQVEAAGHKQYIHIFIYIYICYIHASILKCVVRYQPQLSVAVFYNFLSNYDSA